jgi:hypothetical protein
VAQPTGQAQTDDGQPDQQQNVYEEVSYCFNRP